MSPRELPNKVANQGLIRKVAGKGIMVDNGRGVTIGEVEKILFRKICRVQHGYDGEITFITERNRYFRKSTATGTMHVLREVNGNSEEHYFANIGPRTLSSIYEQAEATATTA